MTPLAVTIRAEGLEIAPGSSGTLIVEVTNLGTVVDRYRCEIVGIPAAWVRVAPVSLELFPAPTGHMDAARADAPPSSGRFTITISPPRSPEATAGSLPFGAKVTSEADPSNRMVEEATIQIKPFGGLTAGLRPALMGGRRGASSSVELANLGNRPEEATLIATDPTDQLRFTFDPARVTIPPGVTTRVPFRFSASSPKILGSAVNRAFTVTVRPTGADPPPLNIVGTFEHRAFLASGLAATFAVALALAMGGIALLNTLHPAAFDPRDAAQATLLVPGAAAAGSPTPHVALPAQTPSPSPAAPSAPPPTASPTVVPSPSPSPSPVPTPRPTPRLTPRPTPTPTPVPTPLPTQPRPFSIVADYRCRTLNDAKSAVVADGFAVGVLSGPADGWVTAQAPAPGTLVAPGAPVNLTFEDEIPCF